MTYLLMPNATELNEAGLGAFATVPFLLSGNLEYLDEANAYLRAKASSKWIGTARSRSAFAAATPLSDNTVMAYGRDLENFLSYLESTRTSWLSIGAEGLRDYLDSMRAGRWSANHTGLARETIKRRIGVAADFLSWASSKGLRSTHNEFEQDRRPNKGEPPATSPSVGRASTSPLRMHRRDPTRLRLPTSEEIDTWVIALRRHTVPSKSLAAETILRVGMRLEEVSLLRASQLPDPDHSQTQRLDMEICYGTKGDRRPGDSAKRGKARSVKLDRPYLQRLMDYRDLQRPLALRKFRSLNPGTPLPLELFLSPTTGDKVSTGSLYKAWHTSPAQPIPGWSPHLGRHAFACRTLLQLLTEEFNLIRAALPSVPRSTVMTHAGNLIDIHLRPLLGHVDSTTTERYLGWLADVLFGTQISGAWSAYLDGDDLA